MGDRFNGEPVSQFTFLIYPRPIVSRMLSLTCTAA